MIVLFPITWPFLAIWLMFRYWRVTLLLLAIGLCAVVYHQSEVIGVGLFLLLLVLVIRIVSARQQLAERRQDVSRQRQLGRVSQAAQDEYAKMEIQAELNARAMAQVAKEMR